MDTFFYIMVCVLSLAVIVLYCAVKNLVSQQRDLLNAIDTLNFKVMQLTTKKRVCKKKTDKESE